MFRKKRNLILKFGFFIAIFIFILFLYNFFWNTNNNMIEINNDLLNSNSSTSTSFVQADEIKLNFSEKPFLDKNFPEMTKENIGNILGVNVIDGITQTFYLPLENDESDVIGTYSYITVNNKNYFLGKTLDRFEEEGIEKFYLTLSSINKKIKVYEWREVLGANYIKTLFLVIQDEIPRLIAEVDGWAFNIDIDNDGKVETVATVGSAPNTTLYKWDFLNRSISFVNLNEATGSYAVEYDKEDHYFKVFIDGKEYNYIYKNNKLYLKN